MAKNAIEALAPQIKACRLCHAKLPHEPNPVFAFHPDAKIIVIGQAPGAKVHDSGIAWNDISGRLLREWLGVSDAEFYDSSLFALMPMAFCYPGKAKSGDLPPRPECAPQWHERLLQEMPQIKLKLLIGQFAHRYYLKEHYVNVTENVRRFEQFQPTVFPLPHPSPLNRRWLKQNRWFGKEVLPQLQLQVSKVIAGEDDP